jgi:hypothetical protein
MRHQAQLLRAARTVVSVLQVLPFASVLRERIERGREPYMHSLPAD